VCWITTGRVFERFYGSDNEVYSATM